MKRYLNTFLLITSFFSITSTFQVAHATYYPNYGDLYYDGRYYADSYLLWTSPGPWPGVDPNPGYEHDLAANPGYLTSCTSATNLPDSYDDCPTAGVSEFGEQWVFSFGSFDAKSIQGNIWYWGGWSLRHGSASTTPIRLIGQAVEHDTCPFDNIWCMQSAASKILLKDIYMNWLGYPTVIQWWEP